MASNFLIVLIFILKENIKRYVGPVLLHQIACITYKLNSKYLPHSNVLSLAHSL